MKILVTHINPHLDDIAAIWLFKKFYPEFKEAEIEFISQTKTGDIGKETTDRIFFGTGGGRFDEHSSPTDEHSSPTDEHSSPTDEHKGDIGESAMSLVWKEIKNKDLAPEDKFEAQALDEIVRWNTLYDTAKMPLGEFDEFSVESFIRSTRNSSKDSLKTVELGCEILDRILPVLVRKQHALADWGKRIEFKTKWGKSVALDSEAFHKTLAYRHGFQLVIQKSPKTGFIGITAPGLSDVDLSPVYKKLIKTEPEAGWYLHQSKKMVLCGSSSSPDAKLSALTTKQLIDIAKSI
ncbi:hypothetical protein HYW46_07275 [Candidatus Daviesbacteria bacterium]|nr:hypothetical protein [Candidatus Daviesbacteria bacterium]